MVKKDNLIVGLDIGTTKVCAIVGEQNNDGSIDIIGIGSSPSKGLRKGVVVNLESTVESIKKAVEEAELMSGVEVDHVYVGIAGSHIKGFNSRGVIAVTGKNKEIGQNDIDRVIDAAKAIAIPMDREIIHILPQEFIIDSQDGIKEPIGMSGVRLEAEVHIVTGSITSSQNVIKSVNRAGLEIKDLVLEQLAASESVLTLDEKELGIAIVDIGGGTTDIAIFIDGSIWHTVVLSIGGDHFTNDIAVGLRTPTSEAEKIKRKYGCGITSMVNEDETIDVPSVGGRNPRILSRRLLCEIIEPRAEELFSLVEREIKNSGYEDLIPAGVVITGGASIMEGLPEVAEQVVDLPVRRGIPKGVGGLIDIVNSPMYATGVGLVLYGSKNQPIHKVSKSQSKGIVHKVGRNVIRWFKDLV
ncbi:MAG: cell division protein FtsA [bacterium]